MSTYDKASLVLIPSGTKEGVVFSQKPTNGDGDFQITRASSATRVNSDGLIEKETQNLLLQSNTFDTTWININTNETGGQSGYDGSSDAWLLSKSAAGGYIYQNVSSGLMTFSVYAKAGSSSWIGLVKGGNSEVYINLSDGSIGYTSVFVIDVTATSIGNGWYRCTLTYNDAFSGSLRIYPAEGNNNTSGTSGNIYIQDAQLNQGLVADSYLETTTTAVYGGITDNIPRLDYTDASCPSLLLEPQRINYIPQSEPFSGGDWLSSASAAIVSNAAISPQGVQNAAEVQGPSGSSFIYDVLNITASTAYTTSFYIKNNDATRTQFFAANESTYSINWDGLTIDSVDSGVYYESVGNDWYRVWSTQDSNSDGQFITRFYPSNAGASIYLYGYQVEEGSYPTSYIPTYGASVTRVADVCEKTSAEDLIGQTEGTIAGEFNYDSGETINRLFSITGADWNTIGSIRFDIINLKPQATIRANTGEPAKIIGTQDINVGTLVKFAVVYTSTTLKMFVNGSQIGSTATLSGSLPSTLDEIRINALGGAFVSDTQNNQLNPYKQALVFKTALTDEEAISLTTI